MNVYLIARKIIQALVLIVSTVIFIYVIYRLMPGNPAQLFLIGARGKNVSKTTLAAIEKSLGLAGGKWNFANFVIYLKDMFTFNFGFDYYRGTTVWDIIASSMPYTLLLLGTAAVLSFLFGLPVGIISTWKRGKRSEALINTSSLILNSIPFFILGILLYVYFVAYYHLFPVTSGFSPSYFHQFTFASFEYILYKMSLPLISLVVVELAAHVLTMRAAMVSVLGEDYIATARAKGVPERTIMFHHAARNAMIPVSTRMALEFALLTSGAVIVEIILSWPGIGHKLYEATLTEDYPLSEGALFVISIIVIIAYSIIDFIHAWLDPRISL